MNHSNKLIAAASGYTNALKGALVSVLANPPKRSQAEHDAFAQRVAELYAVIGVAAENLAAEFAAYTRPE